MTDAKRGLIAGIVMGGVVFFGFGAATGTVIEESKVPSFEVNGHVYDDCTKVDTHTWRCT